MHNPLRLPRKTTSERPKVLLTPQLFALLTWKCASRHNGVHFFDISTSNSGPNMSCFCTFGLGNVLRATTACTISTSQLPKVVRTCGVLYIWTWKCASHGRRALFRHLNVQKRSERAGFLAFSFLQMCVAPQRRATFHLSSGQAPHPPL